jgi:hypothetical protein
MYNLLLLDGIEGGGGGAVRAPVGEPLLVAHRDGEPEHQNVFIDLRRKDNKSSL